MQRATIAMRLAAIVLAPNKNLTLPRLTKNKQNALSFFGSACVLSGLLCALIIVIPGQGVSDRHAARMTGSACLAPQTTSSCDSRGPVLAGRPLSLDTENFGHGVQL